MWEGSPGVKSFLTGWDPHFCVVFCHVLSLYVNVSCSMFLLHLITKLGLCFSVCLRQPQPQADFLSGNGTLNSLGGFLVAPWDAGRGLSEGPCFFQGPTGCLSFVCIKLSDNGGDGKPWYPDGSQVGLRAVPLLCLVIGGAWVGSRSQASCPLPSGSRSH